MRAEIKLYYILVSVGFFVFCIPCCDSFQLQLISGHDRGMMVQSTSQKQAYNISSSKVVFQIGTQLLNVMQGLCDVYKYWITLDVTCGLADKDI